MISTWHIGSERWRRAPTVDDRMGADVNFCSEIVISLNP